MSDVTVSSMAPSRARSDSWQELERALSIVHVAGLELIAETTADGGQSESAARQKFEDVMEGFHGTLEQLGVLPDHLRPVTS